MTDEQKIDLELSKYIGTPLQAIKFAVTQNMDAFYFLHDWIHGDISSWPNYNPEDTQAPSGDAAFEKMEQMLDREPQLKPRLAELLSEHEAPSGDAQRALDDIEGEIKTFLIPALKKLDDPQNYIWFGHAMKSIQIINVAHYKLRAALSQAQGVDFAKIEYALERATHFKTNEDQAKLMTEALEEIRKVK